jgi:hypothetical protein
MTASWEQPFASQNAATVLKPRARLDATVAGGILDVRQDGAADLNAAPATERAGTGVEVSHC